MPRCEICGRKVKKVWTCKECGVKFCSKDGDPKKLLCRDCLSYTAEEPWEEDKELIRDVQQEFEQEEEF